MANYQLTNLTLSTRFELAAQMLDPDRRWGLVSDLSREKGVSRKFLYEIQDFRFGHFCNGLKHLTSKP